MFVSTSPVFYSKRNVLKKCFNKIQFSEHEHVTIGNDVWIGSHAFIKGGVAIGDGAIIAANSVVAKDVPAYHIAGGNPCKIIKKRFDDELINYLLSIKWWDWPASKIFDNLEILCSGDMTKIKEIK
jgi:virginiamycin A acetyltransferase